MRPVADPRRSAAPGACATASIATTTSSSRPDRPVARARAASSDEAVDTASDVRRLSSARLSVIRRYPDSPRFPVASHRMSTGRSRAYPPTLARPVGTLLEARSVRRTAARRRPATLRRRWLSLGPASRLVGRRPGHASPLGRRRAASRRTSRRAATDGSTGARSRRLVAGRRSGRRPLASLGASPERLARAYQRSYADRHGRARCPGRRHGRARALPTRRPAPGRGTRRASRRRTRPTAGARARAEADATALVDDLARRLAGAAA